MPDRRGGWDLREALLRQQAAEAFDRDPLAYARSSYVQYRQPEHVPGVSARTAEAARLTSWGRGPVWDKAGGRGRRHAPSASDGEGLGQFGRRRQRPRRVSRG